jgi:hypothetical protein
MKMNELLIRAKTNLVNKVLPLLVVLWIACVLRGLADIRTVRYLVQVLVQTRNDDVLRDGIDCLIEPSPAKECIPKFASTFFLNEA